jgi:hypothetical protein
MTETANRPADDSGPPLGWKTPLVVLAFYVACVAAATYPVVLSFGTTVPDLLDPLQHLWILRWYKTCLLEGRSPVLCPELQYPTGAPLGNFSPLQFQALLFIPLSLALGSDVLCYNLIWLFGILFTGMGTFLLAWHVLRDRRCAAFAGMLAMLSGPMMMHARGHLELVHVGCFPVFLVAWMRLIDRPSRGRLATAAALYIVVGLCAAYYMVFCTVPATLYLLWQWVGAGRGERWAWLQARLGWLAGFAALAVPVLALVFANQAWAMARGYSLPRPLSEFTHFGAPLWTYLVPTTLHGLGQLLPVNVYAAANFGWSVGERASYLGVVTLLLVAYAALRRVRFAQAGYWWALLATLAVLGCGAYWEVGSFRVGLPALWLKKYVFAFRMIRVPARFNLFVAVAAALVAAAGLRTLLARIPRPGWRLATYAGLIVVALADLATVPFSAQKVPPLPPCYQAILRRDPGATFVEVPQFTSGGSHLYSICGYWQSLHRGRTNAGYSGHGNVRFDNRVTYNSPFSVTCLSNPDYLRAPDGLVFDLACNVGFDDYAWLYLTVNHFDYVVVHQWPGAVPEHRVYLDRLKARLAPAKVYEDAMTAVYARARLRPPTRPVLITEEGWRPAWDGRVMRVVGRTGTIAAYNPDPERPVLFALDAKAFRRARTVRVTSGGRELARWDVLPGRFQTCWSAPLRLPAGLQELTVTSDGEDRPTRDREKPLEWDAGPYSLKVEAVALVPDPNAPDPAARLAEGRRGDESSDGRTR